MLCDSCLALVRRLVQLQEEGHGKGKLPVRELTQVGTSPSIPLANRMEDCYICTEWRKTINLDPLPLFEDMDVDFKENTRLVNRDMEFRFHYQDKKSWEFLLQREDDTMFQKAARSQLSLSTGSEGSLELAAHWFKTCRENHPKCNTQFGSRWYPRRLLDVSESKPRLILTSAQTPDGPYATLSHCWGEDEFLVLTAENMEYFMDGIPLTSLLPSFRDAINVVKFLGVRYIWIDCYCIVQESGSGSHKAEKFLDIAQMRQVYANSILNIGADHAHSPRGGCFIDRQRPSFPLEQFTLPDLDGQQSTRTCRLYTYDDVCAAITTDPKQPLFERAWVYQERILSPRMLHFGLEYLYYE